MTTYLDRIAQRESEILAAKTDILERLAQLDPSDEIASDLAEMLDERDLSALLCDDDLDDAKLASDLDYYYHHYDELLSLITDEHLRAFIADYLPISDASL